MDPTQPAPDPQALQMLMALMGGGNGTTPSQQNNPMQQQAASIPQNPLANGMNASLGATAGASLATPQDMAMQAMMSQIPQQ